MDIKNNMLQGRIHFSTPAQYLIFDAPGCQSCTVAVNSSENLIISGAPRGVWHYLTHPNDLLTENMVTFNYLQNKYFKSSIYDIIELSSTEIEVQAALGNLQCGPLEDLFILVPNGWKFYIIEYREK